MHDIFHPFHRSDWIEWCEYFVIVMFNFIRSQVVNETKKGTSEQITRSLQISLRKKKKPSQLFLRKKYILKLLLCLVLVVVINFDFSFGIHPSNYTSIFVGVKKGKKVFFRIVPLFSRAAFFSVHCIYSIERDSRVDCLHWDLCPLFLPSSFSSSQTRIKKRAKKRLNFCAGRNNNKKPLFRLLRHVPWWFQRHRERRSLDRP